MENEKLWVQTKTKQRCINYLESQVSVQTKTNHQVGHTYRNHSFSKTDDTQRVRSNLGSEIDKFGRDAAGRESVHVDARLAERLGRVCR